MRFRPTVRGWSGDGDVLFVCTNDKSKLMRSVCHSNRLVEISQKGGGRRDDCESSGGDGGDFECQHRREGSGVIRTTLSGWRTPKPIACSGTTEHSSSTGTVEIEMKYSGLCVECRAPSARHSTHVTMQLVKW